MKTFRVEAFWIKTLVSQREVDVNNPNARRSIRFIVKSAAVGVVVGLALRLLGYSQPDFRSPVP